ncbi:hypothetical protein MKY30_10215 [Oceanobacillus sp. FSL W8-0428]|uniref:DUF2268 domain-containing protein n=1 Tax=Oceanobacillus sojae TaxID=582851 RepID=A0A511ZJY2_9BACI|nr:hypothetical protein [Oceanobacillus sojae]GEN87758.1 hypothetical protein OSO01_24970 [Oceanobacillus sojae]
MMQVEIINFVPKFISFYEAVRHEKEEEVIWQIWKERYGFAAVPPGEEGQIIARDMLRKAWPKYEADIEQIKRFDPEKIQMEKALEEVKRLLGCTILVPFNVYLFIGFFEGNPFAAPLKDGKAALAWPVEVEFSEILLRHELTHLVHNKMDSTIR